MAKPKEYQASMAKIRFELKKLLRFGDISKFNNFVLKDGTQITTPADDIAEGVEVYQLDDQGNQTTLDDGDYVLNDGRTFTIKDNLVTTITVAEGDGTDVESDGDGEVDSVETSKEKMNTDGLPEGHDGKHQDPKDAPAMDDQATGDISSRVEALEKQVAELINLINQLGSASNQANEQIMQTVKTGFSKLGYKPAEKSIKSQKAEFSNYEESSKESVSNDALARLRAIRKEIQSKNNRTRLI